MLLLVIRFAVYAAICCALLLVWAEREGGHAAMGIVAGGILTSWAAAVAWIAAIVSERLVVLPLLRLGIHVVAAFAVFALISVGIFTYLQSGGRPYGYWDFILSLGGIVAFAALVDGIIGMPNRAA